MAVFAYYDAEFGNKIQKCKYCLYWNILDLKIRSQLTFDLISASLWLGGYCIQMLVCFMTYFS